MNNNQSKNHRQTTRKLVQKYKFQNKLRSKGYLECGAQQYTHTVREREKGHTALNMQRIMTRPGQNTGEQSLEERKKREGTKYSHHKRSSTN